MAHRGQSCLAGKTTINGLTDSETEARMDACIARSKSSRWVVAGTVDEETAACRAWSGRLAIPLMTWYGSFSLGVSLASDHKATREQLDMNCSDVCPFVRFYQYIWYSYKQVAPWT